MGRIQRVNKVVEPIGETKADGQIMVDIMNRMGYKQAPYTARGVLAEIAQIVPFFAGVKWDELGKQGKQWPVAADGTDTKILHVGTFKRGRLRRPAGVRAAAARSGPAGAGPPVARC